MTDGVPQFMQTIIVLSVGGVLIWLFSFVARFMTLIHDRSDYAETMASGSRDPKAKMETLKQKRQINRLVAVCIATGILTLILLWLHQDR